MIEILKTKLRSDSEANTAGISTFLNPYSYLLLRSHKSLLEKFDHIYVDGQWLCHFLSLFGVSKVKRCSFDNSSVAPIVFKSAQEQGKTVAIIGSDSESVKEFGHYLTATYPGLKIKMVRSGYFESDFERDSVIEQVKEFGIDLVIAGMGAINQERFLSQLKQHGWSGEGYTCGGFIHQTAKKGHRYYPNWVNKWNLRFIYRMYDEPKLLKRYTLDYSKFVFFYTYDVIRYRTK